MDDEYRDNRRKDHTFLWFIDNYSYCWHKNGEYLCSPQFTAFELEGTAWRLRLYPRGAGKKSGDNVSICLDRSEEDFGDVQITLKYVLSILAVDGSTLCSREHEFDFKRGEGYGKPQMIEEVFLRNFTDSFSQDTLTICCKMWIGVGNITKFRKSSARTRIGIQKISFLHVVNNFTKLLRNQKITARIQTPSVEECDISSTVYFGDKSCCEGQLRVEISPFDQNHHILKQKISLIGASGNIVECGEFDNRFDVGRRENQNLALRLTRQAILNKKTEYLPNNELSLLCECTFSTGMELETIEEVQYDLPVAALNLNCNVYKTAEKLSACTSASEDLKDIYVNQRLTDMTLKTKTKSFPAHKLILCARSSVFQAMLTSDMKEKNTDCIQVDDLEDDTVQQLLVFLYSDTLENLHWESAIKLYYAGDKYELENLKVMCASFLVHNLSPSTAGSVLILADAHNDSDLKVAVEYFILRHEEEVYGSEEWEKLIETNSQLLIKTMHLKYKRKKAEPDSTRKRRTLEERIEIV